MGAISAIYMAIIDAKTRWRNYYDYQKRGELKRKRYYKVISMKTFLFKIGMTNFLRRAKTDHISYDIYDNERTFNPPYPCGENIFLKVNWNIFDEIRFYVWHTDRKDLRSRETIWKMDDYHKRHLRGENGLFIYDNFSSHGYALKAIHLGHKLSIDNKEIKYLKIEKIIGVKYSSYK